MVQEMRKRKGLKEVVPGVENVRVDLSGTSEEFANYPTVLRQALDDPLSFSNGSTPDPILFARLPLRSF